jgi:tetratricopeptide (TPR) repeat protein
MERINPVLTPLARSRRRLSCARAPRAVAILVVAVTSAAAFWSAEGQAAGAQPTKEPSGQAEPAFSREAARAIAHGKRAEAEALARARGATDQASAVVLARLAADRGDYDAAAALVQPPATADPTGEAALVLGLLLQQRGRKADARRVLGPVLVGGSRARTAADLARAARAARALDRPDDANSLFADAAAAAPDDPAIHTAWGELFFEEFEPAEAVKSFRTAIKLDAEWAPAYAGLARALAEEDPPAALESARRALEIDGELVDAHLFIAEAALDQDRSAEAHAAIRQALAINPRSPVAQALAAAVAYVEGRSADYEAAVAAALAVNPTYGDVYRVTASRAASTYLYEDAVALARKAVALEPDNVRAEADLGLHLLRTGDEREARRVLEDAFDADRHDLITFNLLNMLDTLDRFATVKAGSAIVRLPPAEAPVLQYYAAPIVEEALAKLGARYQMQPKGPVLVEMFAKHDDFAVRTLGLPGLIGALGACFGRVVTLESPGGSRSPGEFNWQATLWHELAHVFTLQLSRYRVPRWVTEGLSVFEEGRVRPEWARDSELAFARAYADGRVLKLADLNAGFTRPDTVTLAYFEAFQVIELIVDRYGDEGVRTLLRAYAEGLDTDAALKRATGSGLSELQTAFDGRLRQKYAALGRALQVPKGVEIPEKASPAELQNLAARYRDSYPVQLVVGHALSAAGSTDAAMEAFERAAALVPTATGPGSPRASLADLAEKKGDTARALRELISLIADDHTNIAAARKVVALAGRAGDRAALAAAYERIVLIDPFDAGAHTALGRMAFERRDLAVAVREFRAALAAGATDTAAAHCDLGEALVAAGQMAEAKREVVAALEVAPTYERAQELLLAIVERTPRSR